MEKPETLEQKRRQYIRAIAGIMRTLPGNLALDEVCLLGELCLRKTVLELGAWKGLTTRIFLAMGSHVTVIDHFHPRRRSMWGYDENAPSVRPAFENNTGISKWRRKLTVLQMPIREARKRLVDDIAIPPVDLVYCDIGTDRMEIVEALWWVCKVKPKGLFAIHGYGNKTQPEVKATIDEKLMESGEYGYWEPYKSLGFVASFRRKEAPDAT